VVLWGIAFLIPVPGVQVSPGVPTSSPHHYLVRLRCVPTGHGEWKIVEWFAVDQAHRLAKRLPVATARRRTRRRSLADFSAIQPGPA
jgi:hypothetical protein